MRYLFELTPIAALFGLAATLMVPYLGFLVGIVLVMLIAAVILMTVLVALATAPLLIARAVRHPHRGRIDEDPRTTVRHRNIDAEATRVQAR